MATSRPVALVTGANSGLGKFAARALMDAGFQVVGTSRKTAGLDHSQGVTFIDLDVTRDESVASAVEAVIAQFGRIDVLVNNAGMGLAGASEENSIAQTQKLFELEWLSEICFSRERDPRGYPTMSGLRWGFHNTSDWFGSICRAFS